MGLQEIKFTMKSTIYILVLLLLTICCSDSKHEDNYIISIHYQYAIFKNNSMGSNNIYIENFLSIKNNTKDTLLIRNKDIKNHLKMIYKGDSIILNFMSNNDIKIAPLDTIDLNCATNLKQTVKEIPLKVNKDNYRIYNDLTKKNLPYTDDYELIRSTKFGVFQEKYLK